MEKKGVSTWSLFICILKNRVKYFFFAFIINHRFTEAFLIVKCYKKRILKVKKWIQLVICFFKGPMSEIFWCYFVRLSIFFSRSVLFRGNIHVLSKRKVILATYKNLLMQTTEPSLFSHNSVTFQEHNAENWKQILY